MQPDIAAVQRHARAADLGFKACVGGGPGTPPQCRAVGGDDAGCPRQSAPASRGAGPDRPAAGGDGEADRPELRLRSLAGDLQGHRQPAGDLDVDRRADRPLRRADRDLAHPQQAARPRPRIPRSMRSRRRNTARSATPNSTMPPASSPTRTTRFSTRSFAPRRSRCSTANPSKAENRPRSPAAPRC